MVLDHIWRPWPTITCHGDVSMVDRQLGSPLGRWYLNQALKDEKKPGRGTFQAEETGFSVTFPQIVFFFLPSPAIEVSIYQKWNNSWSWSGTRTVASSDMEIISVSKLFSSVSKRGILSISQAEHQGRLLRNTMGGWNTSKFQRRWWLALKIQLGHFLGKCLKLVIIFAGQESDSFPKRQSVLTGRHPQIQAISTRAGGSLLPRPLVPPPRLPEPLILDTPDSGFAFFHSLEVPELKENQTKPNPTKNISCLPCSSDGPWVCCVLLSTVLPSSGRPGCSLLDHPGGLHFSGFLHPCRRRCWATSLLTKGGQLFVFLVCLYSKNKCLFPVAPALRVPLSWSLSSLLSRLCPLHLEG